MVAFTSVPILMSHFTAFFSLEILEQWLWYDSSFGLESINLQW